MMFKDETYECTLYIRLTSGWVTFNRNVNFKSGHQIVGFLFAFFLDYLPIKSTQEACDANKMGPNSRVKGRRKQLNPEKKSHEWLFDVVYSIG